MSVTVAANVINYYANHKINFTLRDESLMELKLIMIPFIGGLIGWFTNIMAIKLIFRPHEPIIIPMLGFTFQGVIPKRRQEIAKNIGEVIEEKLFSSRDLIVQLEDGINDQVFITNLVQYIKQDIINRIPLFVPGKIKVSLGNIVEEILIKELPITLPKIAKKGLDNLGNNIKIGRLVEEKINSLDLKSFEVMVLDVTRRELKHIEYLGGVLGFLIGLAQLLIIVFL